MKKLILLFMSVSLAACSSSFNPFGGDPANGTGMPNQPYNRYGDAPESFSSDGSPRNYSGNSSAPLNVASAGGHLGGGSMDNTDRMKLSRALDNPPGKSTHWVNPSSGITYTVVPTSKVVVNGNPYCRKYSTTSQSGDRTREYSGVACVTSDGTWQSVRSD